MKDCVIDSSSFHQAAVTGNVYSDMIESFSVDHIPTDCFKIMALPHIAIIKCMLSFILLIFLDWWIGGGGPIAWPPKSPDLTLLDLFL
jgi:hypothetical protein